MTSKTISTKTGMKLMEQLIKIWF